MEQRKIEAWLPAEGGSWWVKFSTAVDVSTSVLAQVLAAVALSWEETSDMYSRVCEIFLQPLFQAESSGVFVTDQESIGIFEIGFDLAPRKAF